MVDKDIRDVAYDWTTAVSDITFAVRGLEESILAAGSGSKSWTIFSRLISGSPLWRIQNKIRAISDAFALYESTMEKSATRTLEMAESMEKFIEIRKKMPKGIQAGDVRAVFEGKELKKREGMDNAGLAVLAKSIKDNVIDSDKFKLFQELYETDDKALLIAERELIHTEERMGMFSKQLKFIDELGEAKMIKRFFLRSKRLMDTVSTVFKAVIVGAATAFATTFLPAFGTIAVFVGKAALVLPFVLLAMRWLIDGTKMLIGWRKETLDPVFNYFQETFGGESIWKNFKDLIWGVLTDYVAILKAAWSGDLKGVLYGFWELLKNFVLRVGDLLHSIVRDLLMVIVSPFILIGQAIYDVISGLLGGLRKGAGGLLSGLGMPVLGKIVGGAATGGVRGGMTLVGERGPELVNLPHGSRVHSNANSRSMAGNTIHVHVSGRVGASDTEIRDIADKVAREINMRMNRSGTTRGAF